MHNALPRNSDSVTFGALTNLAKTQPDSVAVIHGSIEISFAELDALVAETAADLVEAIALTPLPEGSFVPTLVAHDIASVVLIHAGYRAGVPIGLIDAGLPEAELLDRIAALGLSGVALAHEQSAVALLPSEFNIVYAAKHPGRSFEPVPIHTQSDLLVLFSSGSTGRAKGIVHGPEIANDPVDSLGQILGTGSGHGPTASIGPFYWGGGMAAVHQLLNGGSIVILPVDGGDAGTLVESFRTAHVGSAILTPTLAVWMARNNVNGTLTDFKNFAIGGEPASFSQLRELDSLLPETASVKTIWGATEICDFFFSDVEADNDSTGLIPIMIGNDTRIRLEPSDDDPPPMYGGNVGEIVYRGAVAHRYLGQPELTELRFGVDPDGVRFWRSGDLAELCPDGKLFRRGRIDDMVKINGKLVEPAESLALLRAVPSIRSVEVLPHTLASGRIVLVAHVVAEDGTSPDAIRRMLMQRLPVHVIPGVLMRHESLPMNSSGKVDRRALQAMQPVAWLENDPCLPSTELEKFLLRELEGILESSTIGVEDDIWFLGLDSLGAVELLAFVADAGVGELAPADLLEHRTIRSLAGILQEGIVKRSSDIVILNPETQGDPLICVPGGGTTVLTFHALAHRFAQTNSLAVVESHGMHTHGKPDRTVEAMAERIVSAADEIRPTGIVTVVGYSAGGFLAWEAAQRLVDNGRRVRVIVIDSAFSPEPNSRRANQQIQTVHEVSLTNKLIRYYRWRTSQVLRQYWILHPGPPRVDRLRYEAFLGITIRALKRYQPSPARFPVLYLASEEQSKFDSWKALTNDLTIRQMEGDHFSMLEEPFAETVASVISEWITTTDAIQQQ